MDAFLAASRGGDFAGLVAVLDPDVVLRADLGALPGGLRETRGAEHVAGQALLFRGRYVAQPAPVNGAPGLVSTSEGKPVAVMSFAISGGRIVGIDILADRDRLRALDLSVLG